MVRLSNSEKILNIVNIILMFVILAIVFLPLYSVIVTSVVSSSEIAEKRYIIFPSRINLGAYKTIFEGSSIIISAYKITIFRVIVGACASLLTSYFAAYAFSKKDLPGRNLLVMIYYFTTLFSGGLIPYYIVVRYAGLMNSIWVYILPSLISVWYTLLIRNFIMNIPDSLVESSKIDGANEVQVMFGIIMPLSIPVLVTIGLFYAIDQWNSWWDAFLFVSDTKKQPLQLVLRNILALTEIRMSSVTGKVTNDVARPPSRAIQNATIVVSTVPIVLIYPFIQKYFVKGIMIGAVKG